MKKTLLTILILAGIGFFSCKQSSKPTKDITKKKLQVLQKIS